MGAISTTKPTLPGKSMQTRIDQFVGASEGQSQRKQVIDSVTQQKYVKFLLELLEGERNEVKRVARSLDMGMNEFIVEAIREKMEKVSGM